jgi:putative IMPACT (imprinted ancient) family translation regulator
MVPATVVTVTIDHAHAGRLDNDLRASPYALRGVAYGPGVTFEVAVAQERVPAFEEWLATVTAGRAVLTLGGLVYLAG